MPAHIHLVQATTTSGSTNVPTGQLLGAINAPQYNTSPNTTLHPSSISNFGGSQPHENRQPFSVLNFCIALQGAFPSQN
jgi:microcystin-dependent protein